MKQKVKKAKPKALKKKEKTQVSSVKFKSKKDPLRPSVILQSIAETLQHNALGGEFDLPSVLMQTHDRSDPRFYMGLHREYYLPVLTNAKFYDKNSDQAMLIFQNQATIIVPAIIGSGIPIREKDVEAPYCKKHGE